jgi:hypothetical protein
VVAHYDQFTAVDETRAMYQAAKTADKRLLVLPSQFDDFHGWMVLTDTSGELSSPATKVAEFIASNTGWLTTFSTRCHREQDQRRRR